ncbi:hypothetical protein CROQUDRAFT_654923 [Cronartium quercuum f. sp. fusiforme G11]|uniref:Uncharacterized protein n=1 Tax=Cronartium quercuum f. sp. fusiforme G11 TaxID=708437 RepID=A0A9P6NK00_9BASI|nr:hypothetical protein CROQUDRAFT_654923 [Cronartium quercuum f. sp. fusiforme G11]
MVFDTTKNKLRMRLRSAMNKLRFSKSNSSLLVLLTPKESNPSFSLPVPAPVLTLPNIISPRIPVSELFESFKVDSIICESSSNSEITNYDKTRQFEHISNTRNLVALHKMLSQGYLKLYS